MCQLGAFICTFAVCSVQSIYVREGEMVSQSKYESRCSSKSIHPASVCVCAVYTEEAGAESWWKLNLHNSSAA